MKPSRIKRRRGLRSIVASFSAAALVCIAALAGGAPANAAQASSLCEFGIVVAVRGTGAPAGTGSLHDGRVYNGGGYGGLEVFRDQLLNISPHPFRIFALNYPADGVSYFGSVTQGRNTLVTELNWLAEQCGEQLPALVVAGYSQGGAVAHNALVDVTGGPNLTAKAKFAISAVVSIADPNYRPGQPFNAPGSTTTGQGRMGPMNNDTVASISSYSYWGFPTAGGPQGMVYKFRAYCSTNDYWCASSNTSDAQTVHSNAGSDFGTSARLWVDYMLTSF
ncbi:cutinase family protein [Microbacterium sp. P04]|uniref:cutinase family protein n=1 Tax=Microbacterium sp. P04 TaxID=3366947 RepID=UPI0037456977